MKLFHQNFLIILSNYFGKTKLILKNILLNSEKFTGVFFTPRDPQKNVQVRL
jgi:hypothetical protein